MHSAISGTWGPTDSTRAMLPPWREMLLRLRTVTTPDEAIEAIGALRELLELEELLVPPEPPLERSRRT
jgi:hypothetical protein